MSFFAQVCYCTIGKFYILRIKENKIVCVGTCRDLSLTDSCLAMFITPIFASTEG